MLEVWKQVVGYEGLYQVSSLGRVKSYPRPATSGGVLKFGVVTGNRHAVVLSKGNVRNMQLVAHLVAAAFLGPSNGLQVLHKNDVTTDDRLENLRYGTHAENMQDKVLNGRSLRGAKHHKAKLTEDQARSIKLRSQEEKTKVLAQEFAVSCQTIQAIKHGNNWGWL